MRIESKSKPATSRRRRHAAEFLFCTAVLVIAGASALFGASSPPPAGAPMRNGTPATAPTTAPMPTPMPTPMPAPMPAPMTAPSAQVSIDNFSFTPHSLVIPAGTRVVWTNRDDIPHTIFSAARPRAFKSQALDTDDQFSFAFTQPGTYRYFCSLHPHMTGEIIVK